MKISIAVILGLRLLTCSAIAQDSAQEFIAKARARRLWEDRYWRLLLHYKPSLFGAKSEARNQEFFLSPKGRNNPQAEMEALIQTSLREDSSDSDGDTRCRFPLRSAWVFSQLGMGPHLHPKKCSKYRTWRDDIHADSVTLVFASAYLNNPSSMYGHTFLRLDQKRHGEKDRLLDYAVNFAAVTDSNDGLLYALYGLDGHYPGRFSAAPYYKKVQEYSNLESRDLWEYRLNLDTAAVDRLVAHVWEMDTPEFGYYFLNKNCSYQLLPLLEVAEPRLQLTDHWPLYVIPPDTVRALARQPGLLSSVVYRPSRVTSMLWRRSHLLPSEISLAEEITRSTAAAWNMLHSLPKERQALVLDSSADYLEHLADFNSKREAQQREILRRVLVSRGRLEIASPPTEIPAPPRPDQGHETLRVGAGYGFGDRRFIETGVRLGLHDLLDPLPGYAKGSSLEMFQLKLRHDLEADKNYVHALDLARIVSLSPYDRWVRHPSWMADAGMRTASELDPRPWKAGYFGLGAGSGAAFETHILRRETAFAMAQADSGVGGIFREGGRLGGGGLAGWLIEICPRWTARLEAGFLAYALGDRRPAGHYGVESSWTLSRDLAFRAGFERRRKYDEALVGLQGYF